MATIIPALGSINQKNNETHFENIKNNNMYNKVKLLLDEFVVMEEMPEFDARYESPRPEIIDTPSYFSWTNVDNQDWTTPAKNQL